MCYKSLDNKRNIGHGSDCVSQTMIGTRHSIEAPVVNNALKRISVKEKKQVSRARQCHMKQRDARLRQIAVVTKLDVLIHSAREHVLLCYRKRNLLRSELNAIPRNALSGVKKNEFCENVV